jgi:(heptosyl)LPS beta-1,4-glucosyltransferase
MIVKNEAANLAASLERVTWADEIVVLDSGSSDNTVEVARSYTDKVFVADDWQGYGVQRQRAQEHATSDWILMIDADEQVTVELKADIERVLQANDQSKAWAMPILPWCFGRFIRHGGWYPAPKVRLYPRLKGRYGSERVHEKLNFDAGVTTGQLKGDLLHYTYRDMEHYLVKSARYAAEWAQQREQEGKRTTLMQGHIHGLGCFLKQYIFKAGFLDGKQGLLLALLSGHSTFVEYADLWSRSQQKSD